MSNSGNTMELVVTSPQEVLFNGLATKLVVPATGGIMGILPHHQMTIAMLESGTVEITDDSDKVQAHDITSGVVEVGNDNKVVVLLKS